MDWKDFIVADWLIDRVGGGNGGGCGCGCLSIMFIGATILATIYHPDVFLPFFIIVILAGGLIVGLAILLLYLIGFIRERWEIKSDLKEQYRLYKKWYKKGKLSPYDANQLQKINKRRGTEEVSMRLKALEEKEKQKAAKKEHKDIYY